VNLLRPIDVKIRKLDITGETKNQDPLALQFIRMDYDSKQEYNQFFSFFRNKLKDLFKILAAAQVFTYYYCSINHIYFLLDRIGDGIFVCKTERNI
jgi:hypothetical protein